MSTRLKIERSGATWIANVNPQPAQQLKLAVPLPLVARDKIVKVSVLETSPQPTVWDETLVSRTRTAGV